MTMRMFLRVLLLAPIIYFAGASRLQANTFSGYVYDSVTGVPIEGAVVTIGNSYPGSAVTGTTDRYGYFEVAGLAVFSDYTVVANAPGYAGWEETMQTPPDSYSIDLEKVCSDLLVETTNQGVRQYIFQGDFAYRQDGNAAECASCFSDIEAQSGEIDSLLALIGAGSDYTEDDSLIWNKCVATWNWLKINALFETGNPAWIAANNYMMANGWPSIQRIAETYLTYGLIPWGTCMSRAQMMTTLLYKTGVPKDRLFICETRWQLRYSQHMYTAVYLIDRWIYLDPSSIGSSINDFEHFASIPLSGGYTDYCHPHKSSLIPGATVSGVPELTNRRVNSGYVFITTPVMGTHVVYDSVTITGFSQDPTITEVTINGKHFLVSAGRFVGYAAVSSGSNRIVAEVTCSAGHFADTVTVYRETGVDGDVDGADDLCDNCPATANPGQEDADGDGIGDACESCCILVRGNLDDDSDDRVNVVDLTFLTAYLFNGGDEPRCWAEGNVDGDVSESINIVDLTYLVAYLFASGPTPATCPR